MLLTKNWRAVIHDISEVDVADAMWNNDGDGNGPRGTEKEAGHSHVRSVRSVRL